MSHAIWRNEVVVVGDSLSLDRRTNHGACNCFGSPFHALPLEVPTFSRNLPPSLEEKKGEGRKEHTLLFGPVRRRPAGRRWGRPLSLYSQAFSAPHKVDISYIHISGSFGLFYSSFFSPLSTTLARVHTRTYGISASRLILSLISPLHFAPFHHALSSYYFYSLWASCSIYTSGGAAFVLEQHTCGRRKEG